VAAKWAQTQARRASVVPGGRHMERPHRLRQRDGWQSNRQVRNIAEVTTAVARGDLSRKITVDVKGEILELKDTSTHGGQLNAFAGEVTRVAREVGTEGKLGGRRKCGVGAPERSHGQRKFHGQQPDRTSTQHLGSSNGHRQRRPFQQDTVDVRGEILQLKETLNTMVDQLNGLLVR